MELLYFQDNNGFLSNKYPTIINKITTTYQDWFKFIEEINTLIYDMYNYFNVKNNDIIGMYLITAFSKVHQSFQSCSILYSYGLEDDVHIILRTMLESLFISSSINNNKNNFNKLLKNQEIENKSKLNNLIRAKLIKDKQIQKINYKEKTRISDFAKKSKYREMYTAYSYLCAYTHIDLNTLEKKYDIKNNKVHSICIAPSVNDICFILTELIGLMLAYIDIIKDYLTKDFSQKLKEFNLKHKQLQKHTEEICEKKQNI